MTALLSQSVIGTSASAFLIVNLLIAGGAAWITGRAISTHWRPMWQALAYCLLLALGTRFVLFALFGAKLFSVSGLIVTLAILATIGAFSFRVSRARKMVAQYPWLYERTGLIGWRERHPSDHRAG